MITSKIIMPIQTDIVKHQAFLKSAFKIALERQETSSSGTFSAEPALKVTDTDCFYAFAESDPTGPSIGVGEFIEMPIRELWERAITAGYPGRTPVGDLIESSLVWLFIHEIEHFILGHFEISGQTALTESGHAERLGLVARVERRPSPVDHFPPEDRTLVEPCLELQADHEAIELMLGPYSNEGWPDLRCRVACIFAVMVLIEREDAKSGVTHKSHPKAATRIFQLLGHLSEMWSLPARLGAASSLPPQAEIEAFSKQVILPAFEDAVLLARVGGAESIVDDLGDPTDFFADVALANSDGWSIPEDFRTPGGQEWARLSRINAKILKALGH